MARQKKTLAEIAKNVKVKHTREPSEEQIELALAWARKEIGIRAVYIALYGEKASSHTSGAYPLLARSLAAHIRSQEN